jgi:hypothetical protein
MAKERGMLKDICEVFVSSGTKANVPSFAEVEDLYPIYIFQPFDRDLNFKRKLSDADFLITRY